MHATLHPALSVGLSVCLSVGWSVTFYFFYQFYFFYDFYFWTSLLLPKWSSDLKYGPCPPARDFGSRVSGLVLPAKNGSPRWYKGGNGFRHVVVVLVEDVHGVEQGDVARGSGSGHVKRWLTYRRRTIQRASESAHRPSDHHELKWEEQ